MPGYDLETHWRKDPFCAENLAKDVKLTLLKNKLRMEMEAKLFEQEDLRMQGYGHLYEQYPFTRNGNFYERYMTGEETEAGWVDDSDFETHYLDEDGNTLKKVIISVQESKK